ncbi:MMPL family transporter [Mangrovivirga sp. M17]|uniref:MMPL family transporter n=1 Tax=Mangrovivirga halotolerans TaxID=2993936 RepID=A0ABT3RW36_9BACT|nr:MMPL family transporter [Mangrovivirga halotolerans]MCX2745375.1 MMPL family transporter [Mangrovivirga halotolerans]
MNNFFYLFYLKTRQHKKTFLGGISFIVVALGLIATQIKLEENILNLIPQDDTIIEAESVFSKLKMNEQLVAHVYVDSTAELSADQLIKKANEIADTVSIAGEDLIDSIRIEFSDAAIGRLYDYYIENIPYYLSKDDYSRLDSQITDEGINKTLSSGIRTLMSPVSVVTKEYLLKDPFGLASGPLKSTREFNRGGQIELYQNHLISEDQRHLIFFIDLKYPSSETENNGKLIKILDDLTESVDTPYHFEYFGKAAVAVGNAQRIKKDILLTVNLALIVLFVFVGLFYRNLHSFFLILLPGAFGALVGIALLVLIRPAISAISLGIGSVLVGVTLDFALHFITHSKHESNVKRLFSDISLPIIISSLTTSSAFFCLLFIGSRALQDLGLFAGISVLSAALFTLTVIPHLVVNKKRDENKSSNLIQRIMNKIASYQFYKSKAILVLVALITVVSLFTWKNYEFESDMMELNYMRPELEHYQDNLNSISDFTLNNVYLVTSGDDIWSAIDRNEDLLRVINSAKEDSLIIDVISVNEIIPTTNEQQIKEQEWNKFWDQRSKSRLINKLDSQAVKIGFAANTFDSFTELIKDDYNGISAEDAKRFLDIFGGNFLINYDDKVGVVTNVKLSDANKARFIDRVEGIPGVVILDKSYFTRRLVSLLNEDFSFLVNISLIVVFIIILLSYGRIELAVITFAPIALSWLWTLGLMGLFGLKFNIVNIIISTFIFGLGIDYSIFMVRGLTQKYKYDKDDQVSFKQSIILSALSTLIGIGVLIFAEHPALKSIAFLAITGIVSVVVLTFIIPPVLYDLLIQSRKDKGRIPFTLSKILNTLFEFVLFVLGCFILSLLIPVLRIPIGDKKKKKLFFHKALQGFCKVIIFSAFSVKKNKIDLDNLNFDKPSVIIANHHSFIDILAVLTLSHKLVLVTNEWVYNSPIFGRIVRYADFILASDGIEDQSAKIQSLIDDGYSIFIFPEGTRQPGFKLSRFKKGAFYLAEQFKLDIQPVILHGTNYLLPKKDGFFLKSGTLTIKALPRIFHDDNAFGNGYSERTKKISKYFKEEYGKVRASLEKPEFFKDIMISNYIYKGPVLEWYLKVKNSLEGNYSLFHKLLPNEGKVVDVGCGYGLMTYALGYSSPDREITAIDYDEEKIAVARNCPDRPENIQFFERDVVEYNYQEADAFIVSDVLHYIKPEKQQLLLNNILEKLLPGGLIIIRDGDSEKENRHNGTKMTEVFSTKSGFNKTANELNYISGSMMKSFAQKNNLKLEIIDNTKLTSNTVFVMKKSI